MKKWHMEGIISLANNDRQKLIVPDLGVVNLWTKSQPLKPRKESSFVDFMRRCVGLLLRYF